MNFSSIGTMQLDNIDLPTVLPEGSYLFTIIRPASTTDFEKGGFSKVTFDAKVSGLSEVMLESGEVAAENVLGKLASKEFMFPTNPNSDEDKARFTQTLGQMRLFLIETLGMDNNLSVAEALATCSGYTFWGKIRHRASKENPDMTFVSIGSTWSDNEA